MVANNTIAQELQSAGHRAEIIKVKLGSAEVAPQTVRVNPKETLKIEGLTFEKAKIDIIGPDLIITDSATGNKIIIPGIGLFMFSVGEAPHFLFSGQEVSTDAILGKIGFIVNLTDKDYITYTSLHLNDHQKTPDSDVSKEEELKQMMRKDPPPEDAPVPPENLNTSDNEYTNAGDESLVTSAVGQPPLPGQEPSTPPRSSAQPTTPGQGGTDSTSERTTFDFDLRLVQVAATESTPAGIRTIQGGGGGQLSFYSPLAANQYSTETIDTISDSSNVVIYADRNTGFGASEMSRVIQLSPNLPDGFEVTSIKISGLPAGFSIAGATYNAGDGSYTVTAPTYDALENISLEINYTNLSTQTLPAITVEGTATFDPGSGFATPTNTTLIFTDSVVIRVQPTASAADYSFAGADWVLSSNPNENRILTGNGNNTVYGGAAKDDITGGSGNDTIYGGAGNDIINAGGGNDTVQTGTGNDTADGGTGTDTIDYSAMTDNITLDLGVSAVTIGAGKTDQITNFENVLAGSGNDTLTGNSADNTLSGGGGDDVFSGGAGNDTINGGTGTNTISYLYAGAGIGALNISAGSITAGAGDVDTISNIQNAIGTNSNDTITGNASNNVLMGMGGNDTFIYSAGNDTIDGGTGTNTLNMIAATGLLNINLAGAQDVNGYITATVNAGANSWLVQNIVNITGTNFNDIMTGDSQDNTLNGGTGSDTIDGGLGNDIIFGGAGTNALTGGGGTDTLRFNDLGGGAITLNLFAGTAVYAGDGLTSTVSTFEIYYLTAGSDTVTMQQTGSEVYGNGGTDTIIFSNYTAGITADLFAGTATGTVSDIINGFTNLTGTGFNDVIRGTDGSNILNGGAGNDDIYAGEYGVDYIDGGTGINILRLGFFTDVVDMTDLDVNGFFSISNSDTSQISGAKNIQTIYAGTGSFYQIYMDSSGVTYYGAVGEDSVIGGAGNDTIYTGNNNSAIDTIYGGGGNDTIFVTVVTGGGASVNGDAGDDVINASAATAGVSLYGGANNDTITGGSGNDLLDGDAGNDTLNGGAGTDSVYYSFASSAVTVNLSITAQQNTIAGGLDTLTNIEDIYASGFNDTLTGDGGNNSIYGLNGNDTINGGAGNDNLYGGQNDDSLEGGDGNDLIQGDSGTDTVTYANATSAVTVSLAITTAQNTVGAGNDTINTIENMIGSTFNDTLTGSTAANTINGGDGNDTIDGGLGNDILNGGNGTDTVSFNTATSAVTVNLATTSATGGGGTDTLSNFENVLGSIYGDNITGDGNDNTITGGDGNDRIQAGDGNDTLIGGNGDDYFNGDVGNDIIDGGAGSLNEVTYGARPSITSGITVNLSIVDGDGFAQVFIGSFGEIDLIKNIQLIEGSIYGDNITGTSGDDIFWGRSGNDVFTGGAGNDTIAFYFDQAATVDLNAGTASGMGNDTFTSIENIHGSGNDDIFYGNSVANFIRGDNGNDIIDGRAGDDTINGQNGNDTIDGGDGNDTMVGEAGTDTLTYATASAGITISLALTTAQNTVGSGTDTISEFENLTGSGFNDTLTGDLNVNTILGGDGNDTIDGGLGNDILNGGNNTDTVAFGTATSSVTASLETNTSSGGGGTDTLSNFENITGSSFGDTLTGDNNDNTLNGGAGNDDLRGRGGADTINGDLGDDVIDGGLGNDTINGGDGNDTIEGGDGNDTMNGGNNTDTLTYSTASGSVSINMITGASTGAGSDTFSNFENITGSAQGDTFTLNPNVYMNFSAINGGAGTDIVAINNGAGTDLDNLSGVQLNTLFDNIETLNLSGATADSQWAITAADIDGMNGAATTFSLIVSQNFNINVGNGAFGAPSSGSSGVINTTALGTQTVTWGTNLTLTIQVV